METITTSQHRCAELLRELDFRGVHSRHGEVYDGCYYVIVDLGRAGYVEVTIKNQKNGYELLWYPHGHVSTKGYVYLESAKTVGDVISTIRSVLDTFAKSVDQTRQLFREKEES